METTNLKTLIKNNINKNPEHIAKRKRQRLLKTLDNVFIITILVLLIAFLSAVYKATEPANASYQEDNYEHIIADLEKTANEYKNKCIDGNLLNTKCELEKAERIEKLIRETQAEPIQIAPLSNEKAKQVQTVAETIKKQEKVNFYTDERVINEAVAFLTKHEGIRLKAYPDFKQWSICYGMKSTPGATATKEECEQGLKERVQNELLRINRQADLIDGNKKVALISFFYNVGFKTDVLSYAKRGDNKSVIYLISQYNMAGGKYIQGLQNRRNTEVLIYNGL